MSKWTFALGENITARVLDVDGDVSAEGNPPKRQIIEIEYPDNAPHSVFHPMTNALREQMASAVRALGKNTDKPQTPVKVTEPTIEVIDSGGGDAPVTVTVPAPVKRVVTANPAPTRRHVQQSNSLQRRPTVTPNLGVPREEAIAAAQKKKVTSSPSLSRRPLATPNVVK